MFNRILHRTGSPFDTNHHTDSLQKILFFLLLILPESCVMRYLSNHELSRDNSNSGKIVVLFEKVPAYSEKFNVQLSVFRRDRKLKWNDSGNIFIGEFDNENKMETIYDAFKAEWIDKKTLRIYYSSLLQVVKKEGRYKSIALVYEKVN